MRVSDEEKQARFHQLPLDDTYKPIFEAILFAVYALGFQPRCALEIEDSGENRLEKIFKIIEQCQLGIHDISAVSLSAGSNLPRFNMPMELGLFLGCKRFGGDVHRQKRCTVLDTEKYRYQKFISDIAGQDIQHHENRPEIAITKVRDWLRSMTGNRSLPAGAEIVDRYHRFRKDLPDACQRAKLEPDKLTYADLLGLIYRWLSAAT